MEPEPKAAKSPDALLWRVMMFLLGGAVNYLLIAMPFKYLKAHTGLPVWGISACSIGVSTTFFFLWNYFVGFRTDSRKRDAFARYLVAVIVLWALSSALLTMFKHFDAHLALSLGKFPLDLDVIATQACFGWLKFIVYHKWAFPMAKNPAAAKP
jgi:putative flippase GtrA